jgi:hypothetical protein
MGPRDLYNVTAHWIAEVQQMRALLMIAAVVGVLAMSDLVGAAAVPLGAQLNEDEVREVVRRANSDEIYGEAYRSANADLLRTAWAGEALLDMTDDIDGLKASGQYLDLQLESMDFRRIEPLGPARVRVVTLERWLARLYQANGVYVGVQRQTVENRYLLDRRDDGWYIIEADQDVQGTEPLPRPPGQ